MIFFFFSFLQIHVKRVVGCGDAKDVICGTVEKLEADTLVMGSHGYGFIKRYKQLILAALSSFNYCLIHSQADCLKTNSFLNFTGLS